MFMEQIKFSECPSLMLLLNWTIQKERPMQLEHKLIQQLYQRPSPHQRLSPPSSAVTELEDFKYFLTASVRPRT